MLTICEMKFISFGMKSKKKLLFLQTFPVFLWYFPIMNLWKLLVNFPDQMPCFLSPAAPKARDGRYCNAPRPSVCLSVCLSVTFSHCNSKTQWCIFSKLCRYVHQVMGVCCIVFDIDGMLFEFFMNFLNIEKNKILRYFF